MLLIFSTGAEPIPASTVDEPFAILGAAPAPAVATIVGSASAAAGDAFTAAESTSATTNVVGCGRGKGRGRGRGRGRGARRGRGSATPSADAPPSNLVVSSAPLAIIGSTPIAVGSEAGIDGGVQVPTAQGEGSQQNTCAQCAPLVFRYRTSGRIKQTARRHLGRIETIDLTDSAPNTQ